jgi:Na+-translocating ferredoxin:NAD+ oxidoreductase RnfG subunit
MSRLSYKNIFNLFLGIAILFAIALHQNRFFGEKIRGKEKERTITVSVEHAGDLFDKAASVEESGKYFNVYDENKKLIGHILHSNTFSPQVRGYNGPVPLLIALTKEKQIRDIRLLPNYETGDFVEILREHHYMDSWNDKSIEEALAMQADAVSGATETAVAIRKNVQFTLEGISSMNSSMVPSNSFSFNRKDIWRYAAQLFFLLFAVLSYFYPKKSGRYRYILLVLSIVILGFWITKMLTLADIYNWLINGMYFRNSIIVILLLGLAIILPVLTGKNFYCNYVCPYGAAQELCGKINVRKYRIPGYIYPYLRTLRKYYLAGIAVFLLAGWTFDLTQTEPFIAFRFQIASSFVVILASAFLLLSTIIKRPWCNYFCPTGLILSLFEIKKIKKNE